MQVADDETIGEHERGLAIVYIMYSFIPDIEEAHDYLEKAIKFLQCGKEASNNDSTAEEADMDIIYDLPYINASFMSDYHIDLSQNNMHFWQFCNLITGLTDKCVLNRIRDLRALDVKDFDKSQRAKLIKAKAQVALPQKVSTEEQERIDFIDSIWGTG